MNIPAQLTQRQMDFFKRAMTAWFNVAEGGKRGGKNVLTTLVFCSLLETHQNKIHLVGGVSGATAKLNILDCDGYGLLNYFEGRCREGKYKDRDCVYVQTKTGEKVVLISGGGKDGDEKLIKGNTYGMAYITEANECHQKFIQEVFDRTLSSYNRKIFHDLNPKEPQHWYYTEVLNYHEERQQQNKGYGYNYGHFTIADNMSLSDDKIRELLRTYKKNTVWYERDIKGNRTVAEGLVFRYLADNPEVYTISEDKIGYREDGKCTRAFSKLIIGVDFGGNGSQTTFNLTGYENGYKIITPLEEDELAITEAVDANMICKKYIEFLRKCMDIYGRVDWTFPDSASPTMINSLISATKEAGITQKIKGCRKNKVEDRPRSVDRLLNTGRMKISTRCPKTLKALQGLRWDEKHPDIPEDKNIGNVNDRWDSLNYTMLDFIEYIDLNR